MTRRSNNRDDPSGRNRVRCADCLETLGFVRPILVVRWLKSLPDVEVRYSEDGKMHLVCPSCGKLNEFKWR